MSRVEFARQSVLIDGKKEQIISGAMHYFRIPEPYWEDRLTKAVQCGLNCVETYLCWNLHEPEEGSFDFSGMLDFEKYVRLAQKLGLYVIVRPGPYICAEWDNGGLPYWLMLKNGIEFRCTNEAYLACVKNYYDVIMPKLAALQYDNGGPVIAMQIENEYGSYSSDHEYLRTLKKMMRDSGITVPLFTSDGVSVSYVANGTMVGVPMTLNGGSGLDGMVQFFKRHRPDDPPFCMEFWCGWFDNWHDGIHHTRDAKSVADEVDDMLSAGGNLNVYMFHGGTSFGFTAGANGALEQKYTPDTTSYDYDAPLSEAGDPTEKYFAIQSVIKKYRPDARFGTPEPSKKKAYGRVHFTEMAPLFDNLDEACSKKTESLLPLSMEKARQAFGFIHYRTTIPGPNDYPVIRLYGVCDRAQIFLDGQLIRTYSRNDETAVIRIPGFSKKSVLLDVLVENFGRINHDQEIGRDFKGISRAVTFNGAACTGWETWSLPMTDLSRIKWKPFTGSLINTPAFYKADLVLDVEPKDTFVLFPGMNGCVLVNGHNIGRYFRRKAEDRTLYLPGCWLKKGHNEIIVFETDQIFRERTYVRFLDEHLL